MVYLSSYSTKGYSLDARIEGKLVVLSWQNAQERETIRYDGTSYLVELSTNRHHPDETFQIDNHLGWFKNLKKPAIAKTLRLYEQGKVLNPHIVSDSTIDLEEVLGAE